MRSTSEGGTKSISLVVPYVVVATPTRTPVPCGPRRTRTRSSVKLPSRVHRGVGLGDDVLLLLVGGQVDDLVGDPPAVHLAVGGLDEAVLVDPRVGGEGADQADVRALGRLDRAHAAVVGAVHVSHLEPGALTREAARPEGRQPALVGQPRQRVVLVHELAELAGAEELLHRGHHRADVDQALWRDRLHVLGGHALAHDALHAREADPHLVLDQLADRAHAPVGEVVLVVDAVGGVAVGHVQRQVQHVGGRRQDLAGTEHSLPGRGALEVEVEELGDPLDLGPELAVQLVAPDPGEVVALGVEEGVLEVLARRLDREGLAGTGALVDLEQRVLAGRGRGSAPSPTGPPGSRSGGRTSPRRRRRRSRGRAGARTATAGACGPPAPPPSRRATASPRCRARSTPPGRGGWCR